MSGVYLADLAPHLEKLNLEEEDYVVVGGLAVGRWAELLLAAEERAAFDLRRLPLPGSSSKPYSKPQQGQT